MTKPADTTEVGKAFDLADLDTLGMGQEDGHEFEFFNPVSGEGTGIFITVVGPDSGRASKARHQMENDIHQFTSRRSTNGRIGPQMREELVNTFMFACVLSWRLQNEGKPLELTRENFNRLLKAGTWIRAQIDAFLDDRSPYFIKAADKPAKQRKA